MEKGTLNITLEQIDKLDHIYTILDQVVLTPMVSPTFTDEQILERCWR